MFQEQNEVEYKNGVKKEKEKKMFPGYILVEMVMSDESWYIVRNTQGVTGFIGSAVRVLNLFLFFLKKLIVYLVVWE